ncbi:hypothetical protein LZ3411_1426 [Levilactobacillus zymae]|uniref:Uncharacterized protein n=1 Tax=Levilactobacillus zymae TaxID=267363 RepID=A0A1Y6JX00_9LACO|nr:hypothetical protein LZ3411_1426 [Levilactobacillus zymae]
MQLWEVHKYNMKIVLETPEVVKDYFETAIFHYSPSKKQVGASVPTCC